MIEPLLVTAIAAHHASTDPLADAITYHATLNTLIERQEQAEAAASRSIRPDTPPDTIGLPAGLLCVRDHESGGDYQIVSATGYQGAYQLSPTYTPAWAQRYGYGQWASTPASQWPPAVQDAVALGLWNQTNGRAWSDFTTYDCPWGT